MSVQTTTLSRAATIAEANQQAIEHARDVERDLDEAVQDADAILARERQWPIEVQKVDRLDAETWRISYHALPPTGEVESHSCAARFAFVAPRMVLLAVAKDWAEVCRRRRDDNVAASLAGVHIRHPWHVVKGDTR